LNWLRRRLRSCGERPRCHCAAKQRDELSPFQLIELHPTPGLQDTELARISQEGALQGPRQSRVGAATPLSIKQPVINVGGLLWALILWLAIMELGRLIGG
jgi:hypothetical protein